MRRWSTVAVLGLWAGCAEKGGESGALGGGAEGSGGGAGADGADSDVPVAAVDLNASGLSLTVSGGAGGYWFGVVESSPGGWTGEDCFYGYTAGDGATYAFCHDAGDGGTTYLVQVATAEQLSTGTTLFNADFTGALTYYLESDPTYGGDGRCYVWGADPAYYEALGCALLAR